MTRVELEVGAETIVVQVPANHWTGSWRDTMTVRALPDTTQIVAVGDPSDAPTTDGAVVRSVLNAPNFDPLLANALIRYLVYRALREAGLGWRAWVATVELRIWYPRWRHIPPIDQTRVLEDPPARAVTVNGEPVVRPWLALPLVDRLLGTRWVAPDTV